MGQDHQKEVKDLGMVEEEEEEELQDQERGQEQEGKKETVSSFIRKAEPPHGYRVICFVALLEIT